MSTQNSDELTLVHEDYIDDNGIDESTLPTEIQEMIKDIDNEIDEYNLLPDGDDAVLFRINNQSKAIVSKIEKWKSGVSTPPVQTAANENSDGEPTNVSASSNQQSSQSQQSQSQPKKEANPFFDMLGL